MKIINGVTIFAVVAGLAWGQPLPRYQIIDLGTLGGSYSYAYGMNDKGQIVGGAATRNQTDGLAQTAFSWYRGRMINLGTLDGSACPNCSSESAAPSADGSVAIISETSKMDPNGEDFCAFGTHRQCLAAVWKDGTMKALPTLPGANNSQTYWMNSKGEAVGFSETGTRDEECILPGQVFRFSAVKWSANGKLTALPPYPGDTVSFAFANNDAGEVVGGSGKCSSVLLPPSPAAPRAVLWGKDGTPVDLGTIAGGTAYVPTGITNNGTVALNIKFEGGGIHVGRWRKDHPSIQDLGKPDGDFVGVTPCCNNVNNRGDVAAFSCPGPFGGCRAVIWHDNKWTDLNDLALPGSPLYLVGVAGLNDDGEIAGVGITPKGDAHGFLAIPARTHADAGGTEDTVTTRAFQLDGTLSTSFDGKPLNYIWTLADGSPSAAIIGANTPTPTVQFSLARGVYKFKLTVVDSSGVGATDTVTVNYAGN